MMPFRQRAYSCSGGYSSEFRLSVDANGRATMEVDGRELPDPSTTKTSNLVNAGRDLGQFVNPMYKVEIGCVPVEPHEQEENLKEK